MGLTVQSIDEGMEGSSEMKILADKLVTSFSEIITRLDSDDNFTSLKTTSENFNNLYIKIKNSYSKAQAISNTARTLSIKTDVFLNNHVSEENNE